MKITESYDKYMEVKEMNSFMIFADRNKQACELRSAAQYLSLLADIIQVENGRIDNDKYMLAESEIKELVSSSAALLSIITAKLAEKE